MAINPNREQKRYDATVTANKAIHAAIEKTRVNVKDLTDDLDQIQVRIQLRENGVQELTNQRKELEAATEQTDESRAKIQELTDQINKLGAEGLADGNLYNEKSEQRRLLQLDIDLKLGCNELKREANQKAALDRQSQRYPAALKRHLIKCRKHGWADARLTSKK